MKKHYWLMGAIFAIFVAIGYGLSVFAPMMHQVVSGLLSVSVILVILSLAMSPSIISSWNLRHFLMLLLFVHSGLLLGVFFGDVTGSILWSADSFTVHVPGAERVVEFLSGEEVSRRINEYDRTYLVHFVVGLLFSVLGVSQIVSGFGLVLIKSAAIVYTYLLGKELFNERVAQIATFCYIVLPTAIYYTTMFYKEAAVQFLVVVVLYHMLRAQRSGIWYHYLLMFIALIFLGNERHYLFPCFVVAIGFMATFSRRISILVKGVLVVIGFGGYIVFVNRYNDLNFKSLFEVLAEYRSLYLGYTDVNAINSQLPYPLAVVKLYFSPYFTLEKFFGYIHFESLITWGSFAYQITAFAAIVGWVKTLFRKNAIEWVVLFIPLGVLLAVFGYVAPYNARLRDSFLALIVIFASKTFYDFGKKWGISR